LAWMHFCWWHCSHHLCVGPGQCGFISLLSTAHAGKMATS